MTETSPGLDVVGTRIAQPDGPAKATGEAKYAGDIRMAGMLVAKVLRSPFPHAVARSIDTAAALALPGVLAVLTPDDLDGWHTFDRGMKDMPLVAGYRVPPEEAVVNRTARHYGDAVAAVAAVDEHTAERALGLLRVDWEELPFVLDAVAAMQPDAPRISDLPEHEHNVAKHLEYPFPEGDVDQALATSHLVCRGTFRTPKQEHCTQETAAALAWVDASGRLNVWSQSQLAHLARRELAAIFDLPVRKVRVLTPFIGGSFGQRGSLTAEPIAAALALKTNRPVRLVYAREENFIALESRTGFDRIDVQAGFNRDGTLTAIKTSMVGKLGGYMACGPMASVIGMALVMGHYRVPNRYGTADMVLTNTPPSGAMRGFGNEVMSFALEQLMDEAAHTLGIDQVELRLRNAKCAGDTAALGLPIESCYLDDCLLQGAARFGWDEKRAALEAERTAAAAASADAGPTGDTAPIGTSGGPAPAPSISRIRRGIGMCTMSHCTGAAPLYLEHSNALVKFNEDGSVDLTVHPAPVGSHIWGALSQICAEELGIRAEDVTIVTGDTDVTLFEYGSDASRSTYAIGGATQRAARQAKEQLLAHAAEMLEAPMEDLAIMDRRVYVKSDPKRGCPVGDVCYDAIYTFGGHAMNFAGKESFEPVWNSPIYGAYFAEVEVDTETGRVHVPRFLVAMDCGKAINPMAVEGQLEGGLQQGLGYALTEDYAIDPKTGRVLSTNYDSYKTPGTLDMPQSEIVIIDKPDPKGPFGAKGVGEPGMVGIAPAIANALYDAVGIRLRELPMTPERVLAALEEVEPTAEDARC